MKHMQHSWIIITALSISLSSCATSKDSTLLGLGIGSVIGASIGASFGASQGRAKEGAAIGALTIGSIGALAGYTEYQRQQRLNGPQMSDHNKETPAMTMPQVRRVWVPDQIDDGRYIQGHFVYIIDKQSSWMLKDSDETLTKEPANGNKRNSKQTND